MSKCKLARITPKKNFYSEKKSTYHCKTTVLPDIFPFSKGFLKETN